MTFRAILLAPLGLLVAFALAGPTPAAAGALGDGATRLVDLQADVTGDNAGNGLDDIDPDDGGWDWYVLTTDSAHTAATSPDNLYGVTAGGLLAAYIAEGGIRTAIGLIDTWSGYLGNPAIDSGPDYGFLVRLSLLTGDPTYANEAKSRWDTKMAGYGGADSLAMLIRDSRHDQNWDGLIPWDIGLYIESAIALQDYFPGQGYLADAIDMADVIYGDLTSPTPFFDMDDDSLPAYYLGLEGVVLSFGLTDVYTSYAVDAGRRLLFAQFENGAWPWSAEYPDYSDVQTTAYVLMGFGALDLPYGIVSNAAQAGSDFLVSVQGANGGWDQDGYEYPEVDGECLRALSYYPPTFGLSGGGMSRIERAPAQDEARPIIRPWTD